MNILKNIWGNIKKHRQFAIFSISSIFFYGSFWFLFQLNNFQLTNPVGSYSNLIAAFWPFIAFIFILLGNLLAIIFFYKHLAKFSFPALFVLFVFISLLLLFSFPVGATDIYCYIFQGRVFSIGHLSPLVTPYQKLSGDLFYNSLSGLQWTKITAPYGPLFIMIESGLSALFKNNLIATLITFKTFFFLINTLNAYLLYRWFGKKAFWFYAFNPLIIFELVINGHNDSIIILLLIICFYIFKKATNNPGFKYYILAFIPLMASVLVKYTSLIILPFFYLISLSAIKTASARIKYSFSLFLIMALMIFLSYIPFGANIYKSLQSTINQFNLTSEIFISPLILIFQAVASYWHLYNYASLAAIASRIIFIIFYICLIFKAWPRRPRQNTENDSFLAFIKYSTLAFAGFCACFFTWFMPWYLCTLLLMLILSLAIFSQKQQKDEQIEKLITTGIYFISIYGIVIYVILR